MFAQDIKFPNVDAIHVFAGLNVPTQNVGADQFRFDYMRFHIDLSNDVIKLQFRHDFSSGNLQLANVSQTFGNFTITAGRFLDPTWQLQPAPHTMSQGAHAISISTFTVLDNGIGITYTGNSISMYASVFDCNGNRNFSASLVHKNGGVFIQKNGSEYGFGWILRESYGKLVNVEGGIVKRANGSNPPPVEFYLQNRAQVFDNLNVWLQGDFQAKSDDEVSRVLVGVAYQYSKNSHLKLFYNFTDKVAVAKVTFFL